MKKEKIMLGCLVALLMGCNTNSNQAVLPKKQVITCAGKSLMPASNLQKCGIQSKDIITLTTRIKSENGKNPGLSLLVNCSSCNKDQWIHKKGCGKFYIAEAASHHFCNHCGEYLYFYLDRIR